MAKNLIIGGFTNYDYNQLKPWVESICEVSPENTHKVVVVGDNVSQETVGKLIKQNFEIVRFNSKQNIPIHVLRFLYIYEYLKDKWKDYKYVVTTDMKDVYFQSDPFVWLKENLGCFTHLVAGSEGMLYKDEPWGNENLMQAYGPYVHELFKNNEIYNVGTIAGDSEYVKDLVFNIFINALNRPIPICDQAVYNVLLQTQPYKDVTLFLKQSSGWAMQAGTTVDPSKIKSFRPFLTEKEPIFEDGIVKTCDGKPFVIVHQYDRVPVWKKHIQEKYKQESDQGYFVYRS
jgi:hypothetical protein